MIRDQFRSHYKKLKTSRQDGWKRTMRNMMIAVGVVLVWNGIGDMFDKYLFTDYPASEIISIALGLAVLYLA